MDLVEIKEILEAESSEFKKAVQSAIAEAGKRRGQLKSEISKSLGLNNAGELSKHDFFTILDGYKEIYGHLDAVLDQAGFSVEARSAWLNKKGAPQSKLRRQIVQMLLEVVIDHYADKRLLHDLHQIREECGGGELPKHGETPLESTLAELGVIKDLGDLSGGMRIVNCIKNEGIVTLGELLARTDGQMLRVPNFGRRSLNDLKAYLNDRFGVDLQDPEVSDPNLERFKDMTRIRLSLQTFAGELLVTQWHKWEKKPEYADLDDRAFRKVLSEKKGEAYVKIFAEPDLLKALEEAGITHQTQLATAPQSVLSRVCYGRTGWKDQLENLLGPTKGYHSVRLSLGMSIPLFLDPEVEVFTS